QPPAGSQERGPRRQRKGGSKGSARGSRVAAWKEPPSSDPRLLPREGVPLSSSAGEGDRGEVVSRHVPPPDHSGRGHGERLPAERDVPQGAPLQLVAAERLPVLLVERVRDVEADRPALVDVPAEPEVDEVVGRDVADE